MASGLVMLAWHDYTAWDHLRPVLNPVDGPIIVAVAAVAQIAGGAAISFRRTAKTGAIVLGAVYLILALTYVPRIAAAPRVYDHWGNFFEQLSLATGAALVYASSSTAWSSRTMYGIGRILFGLCVASFALEQAFYLDNTASLVPPWIRPGPMFWARTTTVAFALAAAALLVNRAALLATRLLTVMIALFGLLVWVPLLFAAPRSHANWSEFAETFAIAGAAWVLADVLGSKMVRPSTSSG